MMQELTARLQQLSFQELQQLCEEGQAGPEGQAAFSASFLFWLSGQEKQAQGSRKQVTAPMHMCFQLRCAVALLTGMHAAHLQLLSKHPGSPCLDWPNHNAARAACCQVADALTGKFVLFQLVQWTCLLASWPIKPAVPNDSCYVCLPLRCC
jgi:hypothetical protein